VLKNLVLFIITIFYLGTAFGQETTVHKHKLTDRITEKISVLKSDKGIRQGLYQAVSEQERAVASGSFDKDKKVGVWHFYDSQGRLVQNYDYTKKALLYEAVEDTTSNLRYYVDKVLTDTDRTTKPVKAGGRYFGYIPYLQLFKLPPYLMEINRMVSVAVVELLVSPYGRLADYKVHIYSGPTYEKVFNMNLNALNEEDKIFIPATVNNQPIGCRIMIKCLIDNDGGIDFF
jgi:hypothetical protein